MFTSQTFEIQEAVIITREYGSNTNTRAVRLLLATVLLFLAIILFIFLYHSAAFSS